MSMPSIPISIFIDKEIKVIEGKTVTGAKCDRIYEGRYSWHGDSFDNLREIAGAKITRADSHYIYTDNGRVIDFGYFHGDLRYYDDAAEIRIGKLKKPVTHGYMVTFAFQDGSCLVMTLYSWSTHFNIRAFDQKNPRLKTATIDAADEKDLTLGRFRAWLADRGHMNIVENCSTAHGAFDIGNDVMSYLLLVSGIHPRTKTRALSDAEVTALYENTAKLMAEYRSGQRVCGYNSLFGGAVEAENDVPRMNANALGKPCPICGIPIGSTPCAGTKMYFCPKCQPLKK